MNCPLCGDSKHMTKAKPLYGKMVCKKCYYKFSNRRQIAYLIDSVLWQIIATILGFGYGMVAIRVMPGISQRQLFASGVVLGFAISLIIACKDGFGGLSIGKLATGVLVVDESTLKPIGFAASFKRNLCLTVPYLSAIAVIVIIVQMPKGQRLGDKWANTRVIWTKYASHPVFTGAELPDPGDGEFLPGDGRPASESKNPFAAPQ